MKLEEKRRAIEAQKKKVKHSQPDMRSVWSQVVLKIEPQYIFLFFPGGSGFYAPPSEDGQDGLPECGEKKRGDHPGQSKLRGRDTISIGPHALRGGQPRQHGAGREMQA